MTSLRKGEPQYKVTIYSIPITDFSTEEGYLNLELVSKEISTFNIGLTLIGKSYQATLKDKRELGLVQTSTIIVAFLDKN